MKPLNKVFWDDMAEMLHVKEMLLKALLRMNTAATRPAFKDALEVYRAGSEKQGEKMRAIFEKSEMFAREKKCDGMMGILLKGQQIIQRTGSGPALDAALLSVCRKITAYNLASYNTLMAWAKLLMKGDRESVAALKEMVRIETEADARFEKILAECDEEAANQVVESTRRPAAAPRKAARELADAPRWGAW